MVGRPFQNIRISTERVVRTRDMCFSTWRARCTFGEALDSQTLTTLLASPGCATLGVDALLDTVPVWFRDTKFVEQVTCRHTQKKNVITYSTLKCPSLCASLLKLTGPVAQRDRHLGYLWPGWQKIYTDTYLTISIVSKSSLQMFLSYYITGMEQQTHNQSTVKCNIHHNIVQCFSFLRQYFIAHKLLFEPATWLCPSVKQVQL